MINLGLINEINISYIELYNLYSCTIILTFGEVNKNLSIRNYKKELEGTELILISGEKISLIEYIDKIRGKINFDKTLISYFETFPACKSEYPDLYKKCLMENNLLNN